MRARLLAFLFSLFSVAVLAFNWLQPHPDRAVAVDMLNQAGDKIGVIVVQPVAKERVLVTVNMRDLTPGFHGFHIHETGICDGDFTSSGGHFDLQNHDHGEHSGDLPPLEADPTGRAFLAVHTARFHFNDLFDGDGSAFIVHAGADNLANIPERYGSTDGTTRANGDAGARIACGVISTRR